jgi:hypothetical protein
MTILVAMMPCDNVVLYSVLQGIQFTLSFRKKNINYCDIVNFIHKIYG